MSNKKKAIDGGKWITISTVISTVFQFVQISVLAKLLEPAAFGLVSISTLVTNFFFLISNLGFSNSIIHKQESDRKTLSTIYILSILLGITIFTILHAVKPLVVMYYHEPRLENILNVSSFYFLIIFFGQTYLFLLQKELKFRSVALIDIVSTLISTAVSITLAMNGFKEMSLIYGGLVMHSIRTVLQIAMGHKLFTPMLYFKPAKIKEHLLFGVYNMGDGLLGFVQSNMDNIFIGGLLGMKALGFYTVAYQLAVFPISKLNPIILQVAYPVLAKMKDDDSKLKQSYQQILDLVSYLNLPLLAGLFITADSVVPLLYGKGWEPSIELIRYFVFASFFTCLSHPLYTLAFTKGKPKLLFYLNIFTICVKVPLMYTFAHYWGTVGVAVAFMLTNFITLVANFSIVHHLIGRFLDVFLPNITKTISFGVAMVVVVGIYKNFIVHNDIYTTIIQIVIGGLIYLILTLLFKIPFEKVKAFAIDYKLIRA
ncbi:MOP flippase family protein [Spirosoma aerophilum]